MTPYTDSNSISPFLGGFGLRSYRHFGVAAGSGSKVPPYLGSDSSHPGLGCCDVGNCRHVR
eukprot:7356640-Pyramimonas_sp.AAC.1